MFLTPEQVRLFRHNGFLKLPTRLSEETLERLKAAIWKDIREAVADVENPQRTLVRGDRIYMGNDS